VSDDIATVIDAKGVRHGIVEPETRKHQRRSISKLSSRRRPRTPP